MVTGSNHSSMLSRSCSGREISWSVFLEAIVLLQEARSMTEVVAEHNDDHLIRGLAAVALAGQSDMVAKKARRG